MPTQQRKKTLDEIFGSTEDGEDGSSNTFQDNSRKSLEDIFGSSVDSGSDQSSNISSSQTNNGYQKTGNPLFDSISDPNNDPAKRKAALDATMAEAQRQKGLLDKFLGGLGSIGKSVAKPLAEVGTSIYNVGSSVGKLAQGDVQGAGEELKKERTVPLLGKTKPAVTGDESLTESLKKQAGYGAEIASTIAPVGKVGTGAKALLKGAAKFGTIGAIGEAGRQLAEGEDLSGKKILTSAATSAAIPVAGRVAGKTIKSAGNIAAEALGKTTGTSAEVIKEAFRNPNVVKYARQAGKDPSALQEQALEEAHKGLSNIIQKRGNEYTRELEKIKMNKADIQPILDNTRDTARKLLTDFNVTISQKGTKLNNLNFEGSTITRNTDVAQKAFNDVMSWTDTSAPGLDRLKKRLKQYADEIPATERGGAHSFIQELQDTVKNGLNDKVPGYREMTRKYAQASELIADIQKALSLKDTASKDTAIRKLMSSFRENQDFRREFVDLLTDASGSDIKGKLAGAALSPLAPRGLAGRLASAGAVPAAIFSPGSIGLIGAYLAASSPKLTAEFTSLVGKITKNMVKTGKFSPEIQNGIRIILQRSLNDKGVQENPDRSQSQRKSLDDIFNE